MYSVPLMLGCDIRKMNDTTLKLVTNKDLIRIDQDAEARPPMYLKHPWLKDKALSMVKFLDDGTYAIAFFNFGEKDDKFFGGNAVENYITFSDFGLPNHAGYDVVTRDVFTGEEHTWREYMRVPVEAHDCRVFIAKLQKR